MAMKLQVSEGCKQRRTFTSADAPNAYANAARGERERSFSDIPDCLPHEERYDEDGDELCIEYVGPTWGEGPAGREWYETLYAILFEMGWVPAELTPALWRFVEPGNDCCLSTIVDDLLFTELHGNGITQRTIQGVNAHIAAPMTVNEWPHEHAGYCIEYFYELEPPAVKLSMPEYATALARRWLPRLVDGERVKGLLHGTELQRALDRLAIAKTRPAKRSKTVEQVQAGTGGVKWIEGSVMPRVTLPCHRLSCVAACPADEELAMTCMLSLVAVVYAHRHEGLVYGGDCAVRDGGAGLGGNLTSNVTLAGGAPAELENINDATFAHVEGKELYSIVITNNGAAVYHRTRKMQCGVGSAHESESVATQKGMEQTDVAVDVRIALGSPPDGPIFIGTDNMANALVGSTWGSPTRSRHFLRRYYLCIQRIKAGRAVLGHVPDTENPADFLTKWVSLAKLEASLAYLTNMKAVAHAVAAAKA
jgi:hypothetical protein